MKFKVIKKFADLKDGNRIYNEGDTYPREGYEPSKERLAELSSIDNRRGEALIKEVKEQKPAKKKEDK